MRFARKQSSTDIYHIMIQGVNSHIIFEDSEDCDYFISLLKRMKEKYDFELYAFCLMDNHVHLLIKASKAEMADLMKSLQVSYHHWFHRKYDYNGHLFNGRYKSKAVESQSYFQNVIRYINNNPVNSGICKSASDYKYSSMRFYLNNKYELLNIDSMIYFFGVLNMSQITNYIMQKSDFVCIDVKDKPLTDQEAIKRIRDVLSTFRVSDYSDLKGRMLYNAVGIIKKCGITIAQLRRYTGLPFNILKIQWKKAYT